MSGEQQGAMKVIQFPKEHIEIRKLEEAKELAKMLIDKCEGDFSIVFKGEDMEHLFADEEGMREYLIATTNKSFLDDILKSKRHSYFKLKED